MLRADVLAEIKAPFINEMNTSIDKGRFNFFRLGTQLSAINLYESLNCFIVVDYPLSGLFNEHKRS